MVSAKARVEGGLIREARRAAGFSQEQLARRADCSTASVRLIESGYSATRSKVLPQILDVLQQVEPAAAVLDQTRELVAGDSTRGVI